jgi:hypothetical protein
MTETSTTAARRPRWWVEILLTLIMYGFYSAIRNRFGSDLGEGAKQAAIDNADRIIDIERSIHLFFESGLQDLFIRWDWFIVPVNLFYGFMHFAATIGTMVYLFVAWPGRYLRWRSVLLATTVLALIGFATFPLMPPRLINECDSPFGACNLRYDFVDTLVDPGGFWSFDSGTMQEISNQYAAMPSLHIGWALWVTFALYPVVRRRWVQSLVVTYPLLTLFAIVVTGNHYWIDAVGGAVILGAGYPLGRAIEPWLPGIPASLDPGPPIEERSPAPLQES